VLDVLFKFGAAHQPSPRNARNASRMPCDEIV
jgi:hypothetical protein